MKLSEVLKKLREDRGITQREAASLLGLSERHYIKYEIGEYDENAKISTKYKALVHDINTDKGDKSKKSDTGKTPETVGELLTTYAKLVKQMEERIDVMGKYIEMLEVKAGVK